MVCEKEKNLMHTVEIFFISLFLRRFKIISLNRIIRLKAEDFAKPLGHVGSEPACLQKLLCGFTF